MRAATAIAVTTTARRIRMPASTPGCFHAAVATRIAADAATAIASSSSIAAAPVATAPVASSPIAAHLSSDLHAAALLTGRALLLLLRTLPLTLFLSGTTSLSALLGGALNGALLRLLSLSLPRLRLRLLLSLLGLLCLTL